MAICYKVDVIAMLKEAGYNTSTIRKDKIMGEAMLQKIRQGKLMSWAVLDTICSLLKCQPGDLIGYVPSHPSKPHFEDLKTQQIAYPLLQATPPRGDMGEGENGRVTPPSTENKEKDYG